MGSRVMIRQMDGKRVFVDQADIIKIEAEKVTPSRSAPMPVRPGKESGQTPSGKGQALSAPAGAGFVVPLAGEDQYGNPVVTRKGAKRDPETKRPYEIWLTEPRMEFVLIPAGDFTMGSEDSKPDERPAHQVQITKSFYLAKYEVTQGQWTSVMRSRPWSRKECVKSDSSNPAVYISWRDCQAFVKKLGSGFRLPSEAEWEYACRAGSPPRVDGPRMGEQAWIRENTGRVGEMYGHRVGKKRPNAWGLYDTYGNVLEWCHDWYESYPNGQQSSPRGPDDGSERVNRGGCFFGSVRFLRPTARFANPPAYRSNALGFRPVCHSPVLRPEK